ncbi:hypothetical protein IW261DRAFT_1443894 [Armillaria novae-zelandiae]|uniref:Yeast cell wall synthesis Kre9/Knh1-like N-terminal domain-containing protein n=1 Tax=Armillaria novae-zelandiae TaxID=153914 RepID=A0AA39UMK0_9AGAR|nr:hypothetical protein IW261DRAFT_1443894 [Armillaria novae-zelandiae]
MKLTFPITMLTALVASAFATPIHIARDVYSPPITSPDANTVWTVNTTQTVTWDASNPPVNISNGASIWLRKDVELAEGFDLRSGQQDVTVPYVAEADDYIIVLFGDSGNFSPEFTITGGPSS